MSEKQSVEKNKQSKVARQLVTQENETQPEGISLAHVQPALALPQSNTNRLKQASLLRMQRTFGNTAVQRLIEPSTLQRDDDEDVIDDENYRTREFFGYEDVANAGGRTGARRFRIGAYTSRASGIVRDAQSNLLRLSERYRDAYSRYESVIDTARADAQFQTMVQGVVIGAAASVAVAALATVVLPEAIVAASLTEAAPTWFAVQAGTNSVASGAGTAIANAMTATGSDLQAGGLEPAVLESEIWRLLNDLNSGINRVNRHSYHLYMLNGATEYLMAEIRRHVEGGQPDLDEETVLDYVEDILASDGDFAPLDRHIISATNQLDRAEQAVSDMLSSEQTVDSLEKDIWVMWIASLSDDDSDILDRDAIEDHLHSIGVLGSGSVLGVDFGDWTSEEDELEAIRAARLEAQRLRRAYDGR